MMGNRPLAITPTCLRAYVDKNRAAIEALLDDDFQFTSPIDNVLDRATYMKICWPNSKLMASFDYIYGCEGGDHAFIVYEARTSTGKCFRNCEVHTVRDSKLLATEVYFGWDLPHKVPQGAHMENEARGMHDFVPSFSGVPGLTTFSPILYIQYVLKVQTCRI